MCCWIPPMEKVFESRSVRMIADGAGSVVAMAPR
jgi:hypothetical protein